MLLALAKKLRAEYAKAPQTESTLPFGALTVIELYPQPRYGEIDGNLVRLDGEGNMVGFSPVTKCVDTHGETAWIPTELIRNISLEPFTFVTTPSRARTPTKTPTRTT